MGCRVREEDEEILGGGCLVKAIEEKSRLSHSSPWHHGRRSTGV